MDKPDRAGQVFIQSAVMNSQTVGGMQLFAIVIAGNAVNG